MTKLYYTSEQTISVSNVDIVQNVISKLSQEYQQANVYPETGTFRWRGPDEIWVQLTLTVETDNVDAGKDKLAQSVVDIGLESDVETARSKIETHG